MKPTTWAQFEELNRDPVRLERLMRVRLIELLFTSDNATAIRAAELLTTTSSESVDDDLSGVPLEKLIEVRERARQYLTSAIGE